MVAADFNPDLHYLTLASWWQGHNWQTPPLDFLSRDGVVVSSGRGLHAAGFIWEDRENNFAMIDMLVTNPENSPRVSAVALISVRDNLAGRTSAKYIMTMCRQESLANLLCMDGKFMKADSNITHLICIR